MTHQIISAIAFSVIAAVTVIGYLRECKRVNKAKKKAEFASKIERKLELANRDNIEILRQLWEEGIVPDQMTNEIVSDNNKEIEQMIEQYKRI